MAFSFERSFDFDLHETTCKKSVLSITSVKNRVGARVRIPEQVAQPIALCGSCRFDSLISINLIRGFQAAGTAYLL
jgi:hypothetical protein